MSANQTSPEISPVKTKKPIYKRWWFWVIVIVAVLGVIGALTDGDDPAKDSATGNGVPSDTQQASTPPEEPKTPIVVDAADLVKVLEDNALKAAKTYKGQYVEISGKLASVDSSGKYFSIDPTNSDFNLTSIQCYIGTSLMDQVADLSKGQEIKVTGTVKDVGEIMGYSIDVDKIQ